MGLLKVAYLKAYLPSITILEPLVVVSVHNINIHLMHAGNFEAVYEI